jgi:DNA-directed RNA polymerase subunit RPC12/RpoP
MNFRAPKYSCSICGKTFRRQKQQYNHVMRNTCGNKKVSRHNEIEQRYETLTDQVFKETMGYEPPKYYGREYNYNPIATGMRHLRSGLPLPRISKYKRAAI